MIVLPLALLLGCVNAPPAALSPLGAPVQFRVTEGRVVQGELLAVSPESVWVRSAGRAPQTMVLAWSGITRAQVDRNGPGYPAARFGLIFGVATGLVMETACSSVDGSCRGTVLLVSVLVSGLLGLMVDASADARNALLIEEPHADRLRPYARFPQGLPPNFR